MRFKRLLNKDIVAGIALIVFSLWVIWEAREFAAAAARFRGISPALFPTILAVGIILLACVMIVRGLRKGRDWQFTFDFHHPNAAIALGLVAGTALYALVLEFLGFLLTTTLYTLVFILWMKGARTLRALIIACATVGAIYVVFHTLMFVPFPKGEIFSLLLGE
ncbi:MAG: tripartite tricarboxylate transporter TctB family protein [Thermodesulfobacteriota bacterium]